MYVPSYALFMLFGIRIIGMNAPAARVGLSFWMHPKRLLDEFSCALAQNAARRAATATVTSLSSGRLPSSPPPVVVAVVHAKECRWLSTRKSATTYRHFVRERIVGVPVPIISRHDERRSVDRVRGCRRKVNSSNVRRACVISVRL